MATSVVTIPDNPTSPPVPARNGLIDALLLLAGLSAPTAATMLSTPAMDEDIWWHLRTGAWILAHKAVPLTDVFSSHAMGQPWIVYSWLFDVLVSRIFTAWGYRGILAMTTLIPLAWTAWFTVFLARFTNPRRAMILAFAAYLALLPMKSPRPWLFTILFFAVELTCLWLARERNRPVWLLPVIPLFAIWANIHIQFVYGLGLIGLFALESCLPAAARKAMSAESGHNLRSTWLWMTLAGSCLATLLNPYGWNLYRVVAQYAAQSAPVTYVQEMHAMPFRNLPNWMSLSLICAALFVLGCARKKNLLLIAALAVSCVFGFRSQRDVWFPVIIAILALASGLPTAVRPEAVRTRRGYWIAIPLSFVIISLLLAGNSRFSNVALRLTVDKNFPASAVSYIESHRLQGPIFNPYDWGGYLIWRLPSMPVSIDGRANLYEDSLAGTTRTLRGEKGWSDDPDFKKARTVLLEQDGALASILRSDPRFRLTYRDELACVFLRVQQ